MYYTIVTSIIPWLLRKHGVEKWHYIVSSHKVTIFVLKNELTKIVSSNKITKLKHGNQGIHDRLSKIQDFL